MDTIIPSLNEILIQRIRQKDKEGIVILYNTFSKVIFGLVLRMVTDREQAESLFLKSFSVIVNSFTEYDSSKSSILTWIINKTRRVCLQEIQKQEDGVELPKSGTVDISSPFEAIFFGGMKIKSISREQKLSEEAIKCKIRAEILLLRNSSLPLPR